jgi:hypothetical protein
MDTTSGSAGVPAEPAKGHLRQWQSLLLLVSPVAQAPQWVGLKDSGG